MALHHRARSVRRPPSLTSERGEVEKAGTKPFDSRDHREIPNEAKSSSVISDFVFANLINSTNGSVGRELRTRSGPAGMECRNAKTNPFEASPSNVLRPCEGPQAARYPIPKTQKQTHSSRGELKANSRCDGFLSAG
jgi:hypothetical protein